MSDAAFLAAIREHPDDDTPRLVYADYLQERGDDARAEFIRVQCELARLAPGDPRQTPLEDREHDLLTEHEPKWLGDIGPFVPCRFRRGFLDEIAADPAGFLDARLAPAGRHITRWRLVPRPTVSDRPEYTVSDPSWHPLRALEIRGDESSGRWAFLADTAALPDLAELDVSYCSDLHLLPERVCGRPLTALTARGVNRDDPAGRAALLAAVRPMPLERLRLPDCDLTAHELATVLRGPLAGTLRDLDVSGNTTLGFDGWRPFCIPDRLRSLDLKDTNLTILGLRFVLASPCCDTLDELTVSRLDHVRLEPEVIAESAFWHRATTLKMTGMFLAADDLVPLCGTATPALRRLDLPCSRLDTAGAERLAAAPWAGGLECLDLSGNALCNQAVAAIAGGRFARLRKLDLSLNTARHATGGRITAGGVAMLAADPALANLRDIHLGYAAIGDAGLDLLLNGPHWRLTELSVTMCGLTAGAARTLAKSRRTARLRHLHLGWNGQLGGDALLPLAESPYLSRACELWTIGVPISDRVRDAFRRRLGWRFRE